MRLTVNLMTKFSVGARGKPASRGHVCVRGLKAEIMKYHHRVVRMGGHHYAVSIADGCRTHRLNRCENMSY
jgi:hypothetical protein